MQMADRRSMEKELDDVVECPVCTEVFTDPRILPCIHTFCLDCLQGCAKNRGRGDLLPCPLCRKEFTIPEAGLPGVKRNLFVEKLVRMRAQSVNESGQEHLGLQCDACSSNDGFRSATVRCVQCDQNYCQRCSRTHSRIKATAGHALVELDPTLPFTEEPGSQSPTATCTEHADKKLEVFCLECKVAACLMCFVQRHKSHECSDIEEFSAELRKTATRNTARAAELLLKTGEVLSRLGKEMDEFVSHVTEVVGAIDSETKKLINSIQDDRVKLLSQVESIKEKRVKELVTSKEGLEQRMAALESTKRSSEALMSVGTACDVAKSANSLQDIADELMLCDVIGHVDSCLPAVHISFAPSALKRDKENLVGHIDEQGGAESAPAVVHVIPEGKYVGAVASLGDEVFIARYDSQQVEVYDAETFTLQRRLVVRGLGSYPLGLAACPANNCLYLSDFFNDAVHRVALSGSNPVMKWTVARRPSSLCLNIEHHVVVMSHDERKFQVFSTRGFLTQTVQLEPGIDLLRRFVQMKSGQFLITHAGSLHRVCLVAGDGRLVGSYGSRPGSTLSQMKCPAGLAVDRHGRVLVADQFNNRLLLLDQSLSSASEVSTVGELQSPCTLFYDQSRRRLYVGEWQAGRVIVIDNVIDFSAFQT